MTERLTDARIDELLAMEAAADAGPWGAECNYCCATYHSGHTIRNDRDHRNGKPLHEDGSIGHEIARVSGGGLHHKSNSDLIIDARNSIRSLLEEVRERRAVEKSCTKPVTPNDHLDLIYETAIARAEKESR